MKRSFPATRILILPGYTTCYTFMAITLFELELEFGTGAIVSSETITKCIDRSLKSTKNWSCDNTGLSILYHPFALFLWFHVYLMCLWSHWHAPNTPTTVPISGKNLNFKRYYERQKVPKVNKCPHVKCITIIHNNLTTQLSNIFIILKRSVSYHVILLSVPIGLWQLIMCVKIFWML